MNNATARLAAESMVSDPSRRCVPFVGLYGATEMPKKTYYEKLKDPRWQKKRLEALEKSEWRCELCYDDETTLHVHHKAYFKGREPWEYDLNQLSVLCEDCHESEHESKDVLMDAVSRLPIDGPRNRSQIGYFVAGVLNLDAEITCKADAISYLIGQHFEDDFFRLLEISKNPKSKLSLLIAELVVEPKD